MPFIIVIVTATLAWLARWEPKVLSNHIPHLLLPKHTADKVQLWLEQ